MALKENYGQSLLSRRSLFWDVDPEEIDFKEDAQFVIGRVLDLGNMEEWLAARELYGLEKIKEAAQAHVFSDRRSLNFWAIILGLPLEKMSCSRNHSLQTPNAFLNR